MTQNLTEIKPMFKSLYDVFTKTTVNKRKVDNSQPIMKKYK